MPARAVDAVRNHRCLGGTAAGLREQRIRSYAEDVRAKFVTSARWAASVTMLSRPPESAQRTRARTRRAAPTPRACPVDLDRRVM